MRVSLSLLVFQHLTLLERSGQGLCLMFSYGYPEVLSSSEASCSRPIRGPLTPSQVTGDINPDRLVKVGLPGVSTIKWKVNRLQGTLQ